LAESFFNFLIRFILAQCIHRPNRRRKPSEKRYLQKQTDNARNGPTYREEGEPRQEQSNNQTHSYSLHEVVVNNYYCPSGLKDKLAGHPWMDLLKGASLPDDIGQADT
jgi:hypothetical protein